MAEPLTPQSFFDLLRIYSFDEDVEAGRPYHHKHNPPPPRFSIVVAAAAHASYHIEHSLNSQQYDLDLLIIWKISRSPSFSIEIGSVSYRRRGSLSLSSSGDPDPPPPPPDHPNLHSYSMDSFDYVIKEEVKVVVPRIFKEEKLPPAPPTSASLDPYPHPPGDEVAEELAQGLRRPPCLLRLLFLQLLSLIRP